MTDKWGGATLREPQKKLPEVKCARCGGILIVIGGGKPPVFCQSPECVAKGAK